MIPGFHKTLLFPMLLLAGCNVGPKYVKPSVPTPPAYKELTPKQQRDWKMAQPRDELARGKWCLDKRLQSVENRA